MKNWKTSLFGVGMAAVNMFGSGTFNSPTGSFDWKNFLVSVGMVGLGAVAKDRNVTGGDTHQ